MQTIPNTPESAVDAAIPARKPTQIAGTPRTALPIPTTEAT
jgi:hypothetical protein